MEDTLQSIGLIDFLSDALNSTLLADANSVEAMQEAIKDYGDETLDFIIPDDSGNDHVVKVPKLAVAPIPLLRIQEANFEVKGELTINSSNNVNQSKINSKDERVVMLRRRLLISPSATTTPKTNNNTTSLKVTMNVKMAQADVPAGLTNLLQIAANNLQVTDKK